MSDGIIRGCFFSSDRRLEASSLDLPGPRRDFFEEGFDFASHFSSLLPQGADGFGLSPRYRLVAPHPYVVADSAGLTLPLYSFFSSGSFKAIYPLPPPLDSSAPFSPPLRMAPPLLWGPFPGMGEAHTPFSIFPPNRDLCTLLLVLLEFTYQFPRPALPFYAEQWSTPLFPQCSSPT